MGTCVFEGVHACVMCAHVYPIEFAAPMGNIGTRIAFAPCIHLPLCVCVRAGVCVCVFTCVLCACGLPSHFSVYFMNRDDILA
jgi:hypothetical protein